MKYLVISDVHANLEALEAVLAAAGQYDRALVLGDLVGYGANPDEVVTRIRALRDAHIIRGNHDKAATGLASVEHFNYLARMAIEWTSAHLTPSSREWLTALPTGPLIVDDLVEICHGAPFDEDAYIFDDLDVRRSFAATVRPLCLFGHTHVPAVFQSADRLQGVLPVRGDRYRLALEPDTKYLMNCGAVGQARDGAPRAAFAVLDSVGRTVTIVRVPYDTSAAQPKIVAAGLPDVLAQRLALGR